MRFEQWRAVGVVVGFWVCVLGPSLLFLWWMFG